MKGGPTGCQKREAEMKGRPAGGQKAIGGEKGQIKT